MRWADINGAVDIIEFRLQRDPLSLGPHVAEELRRMDCPPLSAYFTMDGSSIMVVAAAAYLRVPQADLLAMVSRHDFPGRQIGMEWRFLKSALRDWLRTPSANPNRESFLALAGAWKDDPDLEEIVREAHRKRGRPISEDGA